MPRYSINIALLDIYNHASNQRPLVTTVVYCRYVCGHGPDMDRGQLIEAKGIGPGGAAAVKANDRGGALDAGYQRIMAT
jgi:hypothetical protein